VNVGALFVGIAFVFIALLESFETVILPRTVKRGVRITHLFLALSRVVFRRLARLRPGDFRNAMLGAFGPLTLILLIATWATLLIAGFGLIFWGANVPFTDPAANGSLFLHLYFSGVTFFTLGYGDFTPTDGFGRTLSAIEGGVGFAFLALIIAYVPVVYGAFSRREVGIVMLDTKAGSEPSATKLLRRHADASCMHLLPGLLADYERYAAELLEAYLSYPLLAYYRSQHEDQSWLKALVAVMDACALIEAGIENDEPWAEELRFRARNTFAMARHVLVDLAYILDVPPSPVPSTRLDRDRLRAIRDRLATRDVRLLNSYEADHHLGELRQMYEPYALALADTLALDLPDWIPEKDVADHWMTSAWEGTKHF